MSNRDPCSVCSGGLVGLIYKGKHRATATAACATTVSTSEAARVPVTTALDCPDTTFAAEALGHSELAVIAAVLA